MRVLLLFPMADGQTGPAIKSAFEKLGHAVTTVDAKKVPGNSYVIAQGFKPDLIFCSRTAALARPVIEIKKKFPDAIACAWQLDTRPTIDHWAHLFPLIRACDYYFVVASRLIPEWRKINPNTFWLPQGLQDEVYNKPEKITDKDRQKYTCDVSWAGNRVFPHEFRGAFLDAVARAGVSFKQWGCGGSPQVYNEEHNKMVALSKINLAMSGWPENEKYTSVRNYKIMGAGGFCLELGRKGLQDIFSLDILNVYVTPIGLVERILYWLSRNEERKTVAERGYEWVRANATYTHRIKTALDYMGIN